MPVPVSDVIPNLIGGVSQQAAPLRAPSQFTSHDNAFLSALKGLGKRPSSQYIARLLTASQTTGDANATNDPMVHFIRRDSSEQYVFLFRSGELKAFNLAGTSFPVIYDSGTAAYLACSNPRHDLRALTLADTTIVANRSVTSALASVSSSTTPACGTESVTLNFWNWYAGNIPEQRSATCYNCVRSGVSFSGNVRFLQENVNDAPYLGTDLVEFIITGSTTWDAGNSRWEVTGTYRRTCTLPTAGQGDVRDPNDLTNTTPPSNWTYTSAKLLIAPGMKIIGVKVGSNTIDGTASTHRYHLTGHNTKSMLSVAAAHERLFIDQTLDFTTYYSGGWPTGSVLEGSPITAKPSVITGYVNTCSKYQLSWSTDTFRQEALVDGRTVYRTNSRASVFVDLTASGIPDVLFCKRNVALFWIRQGGYGVRYRVQVDGKAVEYVTPTDDANKIQTSYIVSQLASAIANQLNLGTYGVDYRPGDSVFRIARFDNAALTAEITDSVGNSYTRLAYNQVNSFADLPDTAEHGDVMTVKGSASSGQDDYYVRFEITPTPATDFVVGRGIWVEVDKPCVSDSFDLATMPHIITRKVDNVSGTVTGTPNQIYFQVSKGAWASRSAGDELTAPPPNFVGKKIQDLFLFGNRLHFVSGSGVSASTSDDYYNFWRGTALTSLDTDPIDFESGTASVLTMHSGTPFANRAMVFGDRSQFRLASNNAYTAKSSVFEMESEHDSYSNCRPVNAERKLFVPYKSGSYTQLREFSIDPYNEIAASVPATEHIPTYLSGNPIQLCCVVPERFLATLCSGDRKKIWAYQWANRGDNTVLAGWHSWTPAPSGNGANDDTIYGLGCIDSKLYMVIRRVTGTELEVFNLDIGYTDSTLTYPVLLDRRISVTPAGGTYNAGGNYTTLTLSWDKPSVGTIVATPQPSFGTTGQIITQQAGGAANELRLTGNWENKSIWVGLSYEQSSVFSPFYVRDPVANGGSIADTNGRLQIHRLRVNYSGAVGFSFLVTPSGGRPTSTYALEDQLPAGSGSATSTVSLTSGEFIVWAGGRNEETTINLKNSSMFPAWFSKASWEGNWSPDSRKI